MKIDHQCRRFVVAAIFCIGIIALIKRSAPGETLIDFPRLSGTVQTILLRPNMEMENALGVVLYVTRSECPPLEYGPALRQMTRLGLAVIVIRATVDNQGQAIREATRYLDRHSWTLGLPRFWLAEGDNAAQLVLALAGLGDSYPRLIVTINGFGTAIPAAATALTWSREVTSSWLLVQLEREQILEMRDFSSKLLHDFGSANVHEWQIPANLPYRLDQDRELIYRVVAEYMSSTVTEPKVMKGTGKVVLTSYSSAPDTKSEDLARYCRRLVNWSVADDMFTSYVLPSAVGMAEQGPPWRRMLWLTLYPKVRHERNIYIAALKVAKALRERVSIMPAQHETHLAIATLWTCSSVDSHGFERLLVAAFRSVGIPSRLGESTNTAEFWDGRRWLTIPRTPPPFCLPSFPDLAGVWFANSTLNLS